MWWREIAAVHAVGAKTSLARHAAKKAIKLRPNSAFAHALSGCAHEVAFLIRHPLWLPTPLTPLLEAVCYNAESLLLVFLAALLGVHSVGQPTRQQPALNVASNQSQHAHRPDPKGVQLRVPHARSARALRTFEDALCALGP